MSTARSEEAIPEVPKRAEVWVEYTEEEGGWGKVGDGEIRTQKKREGWKGSPHLPSFTLASTTAELQRTLGRHRIDTVRTRRICPHQRTIYAGCF